jgi:hypothetical protein
MDFYCSILESERTALLIFHHKNIHALPNQPSDRMLTSSEFKQLGCIVGLAFLTGKRIYSCVMNNEALSYIEGCLQSNTFDSVPIQNTLIETEPITVNYKTCR